MKLLDPKGLVDELLRMKPVLTDALEKGHSVLIIVRDSFDVSDVEGYLVLSPRSYGNGADALDALSETACAWSDVIIPNDEITPDEAFNILIDNFKHAYGLE
jgi:hypothetical protein